MQLAGDISAAGDYRGPSLRSGWQCDLVASQTALSWL